MKLKNYQLFLTPYLIMIKKYNLIIKVKILGRIIRLLKYLNNGIEWNQVGDSNHDGDQKSN